jgi:hypothetical protein
LCLGFIASAQSSMYVCTTTGVYWFCYGTTNVENCAYNKCIQYGGKTPVSAGYVSGKGYGAVAVGKKSNGGQAVGFAAGYSTQEDADRMARYYCTQYGGQYPSIDARLLDR